jgi:hypothetical protein
VAYAPAKTAGQAFDGDQLYTRVSVSPILAQAKRRSRSITTQSVRRVDDLVQARAGRVARRSDGGGRRSDRPPRHAGFDPRHFPGDGQGVSTVARQSTPAMALSRQRASARKGARPGHSSRRCNGVLPLRCRFGSEDPQRRSGNQVALKVEIVVNGGVHAEKMLGRSG